MADLFSGAQKNQLEKVFEDMHDTFARDITIYKVKKDIFVATNQTYNALYSRIKDATSSKKTVSSTTVSARVQYLSKQYVSEEAGFKAPTNLPISEGQLRIKLNESGYTSFKFPCAYICEVSARFYCRCMFVGESIDFRLVVFGHFYF